MKKLLLVITALAIVLSACSISGHQPAPTQNMQADTPVSPTAAASSTPAATQALTDAAPAAATLEPTVPATATEMPVAENSSPLPTATLTPYTVGPDKFPPTTDPLTGLPVNEPNALNRRPVAVKVQLYPRGQRPVYGVSLADLVFDFYQNDGLTRLNAIFYGNDAEKIGPVRSARLFDENIIQMYKAIFAFGGAASYVRNRFYNAEYADRLITERNRNCPPMCRVDPNGFNFLFTNSSELSIYAINKGINNNRQNLNGMSFDSQVPAGGQPGSQLSTRYSISAYVRWDYDPTSGRYLRFQDDQEARDSQSEVYTPMMDGMTGQQIAADNVVVLFLPHEPANIQGDKEALNIQLSGSGDAIAFRDGQAYQVQWNRPTKASALFLTTADGEPFPFKPGNTWYQVVGISSQVTNPAAGVWRIISKNP